MRTIVFASFVSVTLGISGAAQAQAQPQAQTQPERDPREERGGREERRSREGRDRSSRRYDRDAVERESNAATPQAAGTPSAGASSAGMSSPGVTATTQPGRAARMEDAYGLLLQRSIFARSGTAAAVRPPATTTTAPTAPQLSPEQAVVFVGVLAQDGEYVAFAENQTTRQLMILRTGDDVARGKIVAITLDTMAYGTGGSIKVVHLGQNLAGELVNSALASGGAPTTGPAAASGTTGSSPPASPEQAAILERLRQRRNAGQ